MIFAEFYYYFPYKFIIEKSVLQVILIHVLFNFTKSYLHMYH